MPPTPFLFVFLWSRAPWRNFPKVRAHLNYSRTHSGPNIYFLNPPFSMCDHFVSNGNPIFDFSAGTLRGVDPSNHQHIECLHLLPRGYGGSISYHKSKYIGVRSPNGRHIFWTSVIWRQSIVWKQHIWYEEKIYCMEIPRRSPGNSLMGSGSDTLSPIRKFLWNFLMRYLFSATSG